MRAVLFDFDGVLVDSEPLHFRALRDSLVAERIAIDEDEYRACYLGYDDSTSVRLALERHGWAFDPESVDRIARRKALCFEGLLPEVPVCPGARDLVRALGADVPLAIASGARRVEIEAILEATGLRGAFTAVVGADDVGRAKPDPEPYLAAMRALRGRAASLEPAQCLVIEDSVAGIAAGRAAGMRVLAVARSSAPARLSLAHRVVPTLEGVGPADLRALFD